MWPCISVITNDLGHMYVYSSSKAGERVKFHVNRFKHNIKHCWGGGNIIHPPSKGKEPD